VKKLIAADWIAPMDRPVIRHGAVVISGERIIAIGDLQNLRAKLPDAPLEDLGQSIIVPGLINAHTHLELSHIQREPAPSGGLADWLIRVIKKNILPQGELEKAVAKAVAIGVRQCIHFGVTTVGDISRNCRLTRSILSRLPLRVVSYGEVQAMGERRILLDERLAAAAEKSEALNLRIGISPHALYSIEPEGYRRCLLEARQRNLPLATHLAESPDEVTFLAHHGGSLRKVWDFLGGYDHDIPTFQLGPIRLAQTLGLLDYPKTLLAHVNYCDDAELDILAAGKASVVYNPRTHAYFQHPPHRWREMLARGINVAIGTDSTASSGDLNLMEDLRLLRKLAPDYPVAEIWQLATTRAARALDVAPISGSITPMKLADLAVFPATGPDPLASILDEPIPLSRLYIGGEIPALP
jgi:cytosine/adenosine deaminase-related metal-dependent hydrolase